MNRTGVRRRLRLLLLAGSVVLVVPAAAFAHHILGIPHYSYDKDYPQTPVLTYRVDAGAYEVKMTGYPGMPVPGERCSIHVYIRRRDDGKPFDGAVTLQVRRERILGSGSLVYGPITGKLDESVYKFYPEYPDEANYVVRITFRADGAPWKIDLPIVVGQPGSPWIVLGLVVALLAVFLLIVRAVRIKMRRRQGVRGAVAGGPRPRCAGSQGGPA